MRKIGNKTKVATLGIAFLMVLGLTAVTSNPGKDFNPALAEGTQYEKVIASNVIYVGSSSYSRYDFVVNDTDWSVASANNAYMGTSGQSTYDKTKLENSNDLAVVKGAFPNVDSSKVGYNAFYSVSSFKDIAKITFTTTAKVTGSSDLTTVQYDLVYKTSNTDWTKVVLDADSPTKQDDNTRKEILNFVYTFSGFDNVEAQFGIVFYSDYYIKLPGAELTLYKKATEPLEQYTLTYDANNGINPPPAVTANEGTEIKVSDKVYTVEDQTYTMTYEGHVFVSWNTDAQGGGDSYNPGETLTLDSNVTLYAQWLEVAEYASKSITSSELGLTLSYETGYSTNADYKYSDAKTNVVDENGNIVLKAKSGNLSNIAPYSKRINKISYMTTGTNVNATATFNFGETADDLSYSVKIGANTDYLINDDEWITISMPEEDYLYFSIVSTNNNITFKEIKIMFETFTVTYNANGGVEADIVDTFEVGTDATARENPFTYEGHVFVGWNTSADGSGTPYSEGQTLPSLTKDSNLTLYAHWEEVDYYTITYKANSGVGDDIVDTIEVGDYTDARENSFTHNDKIFICWNTSADGSGTPYSEGQTLPSLTKDSNLTLYAIWGSYLVKKVKASDIVSGNKYFITASDSSGIYYLKGGSQFGYDSAGAVPVVFDRSQYNLSYTWTFTSKEVDTGTGTKTVWNIQSLHPLQISGGSNATHIRSTSDSNLTNVIISPSNTSEDECYITTDTETPRYLMDYVSDGEHLKWRNYLLKDIKNNGIYSLQLYELYLEQSYSVTYHANNTSEEADIIDVIDTNLNTVARKNTFTAPQAKQFVSWNTLADGSGNSYIEGATINAQQPNSNLDLYAQWEDIASYTINFDKGDVESWSNIPEPQDILPNDKVTKPQDPTTTEDNLVFNCWTLNGQPYDFDTPVTSSFTLVATWKYNGNAANFINPDILNLSGSSYYSGRAKGHKWTSLRLYYKSIQGNKSNSSTIYNDTEFAYPIKSITFTIEQVSSPSAYLLLNFGNSVNPTSENPIKIGGDSEEYIITSSGTFTVPVPENLNPKYYSLTWEGSAAGYIASMKFNLDGYELSFDAKGGTGTTPASVYFNERTSITIPDGTGLAKDSVNFVTWLDDKGNEYKPGNEYEFDRDTVLYAKYAAYYSGESIYLDLSQFTSWEEYEPIFKVHLWNDSSSYDVEGYNIHGDSNTHIYEFRIPGSASSYTWGVFYRINPQKTSEIWEQSVDLALNNANNVFQLRWRHSGDDQHDKCDGSWEWRLSDQFREDCFENYVLESCNCDGKGNYGNSLNNWPALKSEFNHMSDKAQSLFTHSQKHEGAVERYDYLIGKYGKEVFENFAARYVSINSSTNFVTIFSDINDATNASTITLICALATCLAIGGYFFIKRKRED